jgi:hypothetical protein
MGPGAIIDSSPAHRDPHIVTLDLDRHILVRRHGGYGHDDGGAAGC